jgi:COP9 signalosome complex subunit 5
MYNSKKGALKPAEEALKTAPTADARYTFDEEALTKLRKDSPWMRSPKYFHKVAVSPTAVARILMHCQSGCEKGVAKGGNPIEVMGMLLGRPDPETPETMVVTDAFPLPIEGFETRVIADDEEVVNHMIALGEALEKTRKERFCGWYHSHPFDLGAHSHCFLSQTDLSTQLQWQRAEDPHGNPFVAIVVDPLRSAHLETPELKAFRAYPPEFMPPANECPDGSKQINEQARLELWGSCWNRYYELEVEYYMSQASRNVLESLTKNYLWIRSLTRPTGFQPTLEKASDAYQAALASSSTRDSAMRGTADTVGGIVSPRTKDLHTAVRTLSEAAVQQASQVSLQNTKETVFS